MNMRPIIIIIMVLLFFNSCKNSQKKADIQPLEKEKKSHLFFDIENTKRAKNKHLISREKALSGQKSIKVSKPDSYSTTFEIRADELDTSRLHSANISFWVLPENAGFKSIFVFTIKDSLDKNTLFWSGARVKNDDSQSNEWFQYSFSCEIPDSAVANAGIAKFYVWHQDSTTVYFDDIFITFGDDETDFPSVFENYESSTYHSDNTSEQAHNGRFALKAEQDKTTFFSPRKALNHIETNVNALSFSGWIFPQKTTQEAVFLFTIADSNGYIHYLREKPMEHYKLTPNTWNKIAYEIPLLNFDEFKKYELNFRIENRGKTFYLDDVYMLFKQTNRDTLFSYCDLTKGSFASQKLKNHPPYAQLIMRPIDMDVPEIENRSKNLAGNFTEIQADETLTIEKNGNWKLKSEEKELGANVKLFETSETPVKYFVGNFISKTSEDELLQILDNGKIFRLFYFHLIDRNFVPYFSEKQNFEGIYAGIDSLKPYHKLYNVNLDESGEMTILVNNQNTLSVRLIQFQETGFDVIAKIEFRDFANGLNPKYYSNVEVSSINFINEDKLSTSALILQSAGTEKLPAFSKYYVFE